MLQSTGDYAETIKLGRFLENEMGDAESIQPELSVADDTTMSRAEALIKIRYEQTKVLDRYVRGHPAGPNKDREQDTN